MNSKYPNTNLIMRQFDINHHAQYQVAQKDLKRVLTPTDLENMYRMKLWAASLSEGDARRLAAHAMMCNELCIRHANKVIDYLVQNKVKETKLACRVLKTVMSEYKFVKGVGTEKDKQDDILEIHDLSDDFLEDYARQMQDLRNTIMLGCTTLGFSPKNAQEREMAIDIHVAVLFCISANCYHDAMFKEINRQLGADTDILLNSDIKDWNSCMLIALKKIISTLGLPSIAKMRDQRGMDLAIKILVKDINEIIGQNCKDWDDLDALHRKRELDKQREQQQRWEAIKAKARKKSAESRARNKQEQAEAKARRLGSKK